MVVGIGEEDVEATEALQRYAILLASSGRALLPIIPDSPYYCKPDIAIL